MIRKPEVLRDYSKMNPLSQVQFGNNVISALIANSAVFIPSDLPVPTGELTMVCNNLSMKYNEFKTGGSGKKEAFLLAQAIYVIKFDLTADYVEFVASKSGSSAASVIELASFHVTKTETDPAIVPGTPIAEMEISNNERGTVTVDVKTVEGAKTFLYTMATPDFDITVNGNQVTFKVGDSIATVVVSTKREVKFQGLPAAEVTAAVAALNSAGMGPFSAVTDVKIP